MTKRRLSSIAAIVMAACTVVAPVDARQSTTEQTADAASSETATPTVEISSRDLARIRRALGSEPAVGIGGDQLRFYMQIQARRLGFADFVRNYDFVNGPTRRGNPMTHNEFVAMVTPKEMQSSLGISALETLEFAFSGWLAQTLIKRAFEEMQAARSEREVQDIRDRIERELSVLRGAEAR